MCKVAGVTKITDKNRDDVWLLMMTLGDIISFGNMDGLGYAALDKSGRLFGEKWLLNKTAFTDMLYNSKIDAKSIKDFYDSFGVVDRDNAISMILHTRMATCGRGIENTHPHIDDFKNPTAALIHNGIITNSRQFTNKFSTCDSEVIIHEYMKAKVTEKLENLNQFTDKMRGWFTCLVLSKDQSDRPIMDIFTDSRRLDSYYIPTLETRVFSTRGPDIIKACESVGLSYTDPMSLNDNSAMRLDAITGETLDSAIIKTYDWRNQNDYSLDDDLWANWLEAKGWK